MKTAIVKLPKLFRSLFPFSEHSRELSSLKCKYMSSEILVS